MSITCSIYVLIAVSFLCTASANESSVPREQGNLAKRVKINTKNIDAMERKILKSKAILESKVADLEGEDEVMDRKVMALKKKAKELNDDIVAFNGTVMDVNENIADLTVRIQNTTEDVNGAVLEIEGKVNDSSQVIADLGRQIKKTTEVLNGDVLRLDEKFTNADVEVEGKVGVLNEEIADLGGQLNATKEKIKRLEEALEVALKVEEIQFFGVASQSSTLDPSNNNYAAAKCIDGSKSETRFCHTDQQDADPWWKLTFTNDVVINRIMIYSERRMQYTAGNKVSIFSTTGSIVWEHTIEKEEKLVYVIDVPNVVGQNVKIDKPFQPWPDTNYIIMREVAVFGHYD